jgi:hypothetical protein
MMTFRFPSEQEAREFAARYDKDVMYQVRVIRQPNHWLVEVYSYTD